MDIKPPCETCDYFNLIGTDEDGTITGDCRRKSPVPIPIDGATLRSVNEVGELIPFASWPRVFADSWCGEHSKWGALQVGSCVITPQ